MRLVGQPDMQCDVEHLYADSGMHFVKTHDLPKDDKSPAVVLIRDGRDAAVSYAYFALKTEQGIERPSPDLFETTLRQIIIDNTFGGWSGNVNAWLKRGGRDVVIRYEDLVKDPINIAAAALRRVGIRPASDALTPPSFQELHASVPWFFRKGKAGAWQLEMSKNLQELFMERHGDTLLSLGYSEASASNRSPLG